VAAAKPDAVITAVGALRPLPAIPGIDKPYVRRAEAVAQRTDPAALGPAVVILGDGMIALELAEWLNNAGKLVTVVDAASKLGAGLPVVRRARMLHELARDGVRLVPGAADIAIGDGGVTWRDGEGRAHGASADQVLVAAPPLEDLTLAGELARAGFAVYSAGDCTGHPYLEGAIRAVADIVDGL
jgi:2,4-dienoyl-CoA reductase (NADPH2)